MHSRLYEYRVRVNNYLLKSISVDFRYYLPSRYLPNYFQNYGIGLRSLGLVVVVLLLLFPDQSLWSL